MDVLDPFLCEEDYQGEDFSLLDNRPVDQKLIGKRSQGHMQKKLPVIDDHQSTAHHNRFSQRSSPPSEQVETTNNRHHNIPSETDDAVAIKDKRNTSSSKISSAFQSFYYRSPSTKSNPYQVGHERLSNEKRTKDLNEMDHHQLLLSQETQVKDRLCSTKAPEISNAPTKRHVKTAASFANRTDDSVVSDAVFMNQFKKEPSSLGNLIQFD